MVGGDLILEHLFMLPDEMIRAGNLLDIRISAVVAILENILQRGRVGIVVMTGIPVVVRINGGKRRSSRDILVVVHGNRRLALLRDLVLDLSTGEEVVLVIGVGPLVADERVS